MATTGFPGLGFFIQAAETVLRRQKLRLRELGATTDSPAKEAVVFVIDDDEAAGTGLKQLLESMGLDVLLFQSATEFLKGTLPDKTCCLVTEAALPEMNGLKLQEELAKAKSQVPIVFITRDRSIATAVRAIVSGAVDFLTKPYSDQDLLDAVFAALERDQEWRAQKETLSALRERFNSLSAREREVLFRVAAGRLNKQIAVELGISEVMVKVHRSNAMRKMNAKSVAELVRMSDLLQSEVLATASHGDAPRAASFRKRSRYADFLNRALTQQAGSPPASRRR